MVLALALVAACISGSAPRVAFAEDYPSWAEVEAARKSTAATQTQLARIDAALGDRVTFRGYVTEAELRDAYTRATVFAMPSIAELQSIATMEAMASGLPIVAANAMALPHLVADGQNGFLFSPSDPDDLAEKLRTVLEMDADSLTTMKQESLNRIVAHDIQRTISTFESLYRGEPVAELATNAAPAASAE